jgi:copper oxidase (laccase) domain-containing protein
MERLGARSHRIVAAIGPAISKAAYEVGPEFREAFLLADEANERYFSLPQEGGRPHFDLLSYVKAKLSARGIEHADDVSLCTYGNESIFFSHRRSVHRSEPDYGRQISAILVT